jgi:O-acetyl-ADP-ribose deacetylase (regulator of RNase III)
MITYVTGNLLKSEAEAWVNAVNCVGVMGKGIALQFKRAFPENFRSYQQACRDGLVRPGKMFTFRNGPSKNPRYIINFPTKRHWREKSKMEYIQNGLEAMVEEICKLGIRSVAVPPLGCGNGGLDWEEVRSLLERTFSRIPEVQVFVYCP